MAISAEDVKKLREQTGAGMLASKNAPDEAKGHIDKAKAIPNEAGFARATTRADRAPGGGPGHRCRFPAPAPFGLGVRATATATLERSVDYARLRHIV